MKRSKIDFSSEVPVINPCPEATTIFSVAAEKLKSRDMAVDVLSLINTEMTEEFADLEKILEKRESIEQTTCNLLDSFVKITSQAVDSLTNETMWRVKPTINLEREIDNEISVITASSIDSHWKN